VSGAYGEDVGWPHPRWCEQGESCTIDEPDGSHAGPADDIQLANGVSVDLEITQGREDEEPTLTVSRYENPRRRYATAELKLPVSAARRVLARLDEMLKELDNAAATPDEVTS
jgi:hypothetical protein